MKLVDSLIISAAVGFLVIGIHQVMTVGFKENYFIFMLCMGCLFWFQLRRNNRKRAAEANSEDTSKKKK